MSLLKVSILQFFNSPIFQNISILMKARLFTPSYICIMAANFLMFFGFWTLIPVLPFYLKEHFGCAESILGIVLSCYTVSALCVRPFSGYIMDSFPRKPIYIFCYFLCTSMFIGYMLASTLTLFIILRTLHGAGFGGVTVGGNTIVVDIMPSSRRGEGLGYYGLTNNVAMALGPMTGLFMHGVVPYDGIFLTSFLTTVTGLVMASLVKTPKKPMVKRPPISLDRFILLKGIPVSVSLLLLSIPYGATTNFVAMYAKQIGMDVPTGLFFTFMAVGMGISRTFAGKKVDKGYIPECIHYGYFPVITAFIALGCCKYIMPESTTAAEGVFFTVPLLLGIGFGVMFPAMNSLYISLAPNNQRATATSTYLTAWDVGIGLGISLSGIIADHFGFSTVYLIGSSLSLVSMLFFDLVVTPHFRKNRLR